MRSAHYISASLMSRIKPSSMTPQQKNALLDELWSMIALLNNIDEVRAFFKDLLSETEAIMLARRIRIARLLLQGETYEDIRLSTKAASNTIASIQQWLEGENKGYKTALPALEKEMKRRLRVKARVSPSKDEQPLEWLKTKYPLHFLLFNAWDAYHDAAPKRLRSKKHLKT